MYSLVHLHWLLPAPMMQHKPHIHIIKSASARWPLYDTSKTNFSLTANHLLKSCSDICNAVCLCISCASRQQNETNVISCNTCLIRLFSFLLARSIFHDSAVFKSCYFSVCNDLQIVF